MGRQIRQVRENLMHFSALSVQSVARKPNIVLAIFPGLALATMLRANG